MSWDFCTIELFRLSKSGERKTRYYIWLLRDQGGHRIMADRSAQDRWGSNHTKSAVREPPPPIALHRRAGAGKCGILARIRSNSRSLGRRSSRLSLSAPAAARMAVPVPARRWLVPVEANRPPLCSTHCTTGGVPRPNQPATKPTVVAASAATTPIAIRPLEGNVGQTAERLSSLIGFRDASVRLATARLCSTESL